MNPAAGLCKGAADGSEILQEQKGGGMQLSKRLAAVAALAEGAECLADVGTDHGYVPIFLVQSGKAARAMAMDVREGPLARARENVRRFGLEDRISLRLSDGLRALAPGEADTVVIAGMGGALTVRILTEGCGALAGVQKLILQPQSEIPMVRRFLLENGWSVTAEDMVEEDGKFYPMMRAVHGTAGIWSPMELKFGKFLLEGKNACLARFLAREEKTYRAMAKDLEKRIGPAASSGLERARRELALIREAEKYYGP